MNFLNMMAFVVASGLGASPTASSESSFCLITQAILKVTYSEQAAYELCVSWEEFRVTGGGSIPLAVVISTKEETVDASLGACALEPFRVMPVKLASSEANFSAPYFLLSLEKKGGHYEFEFREGPKTGIADPIAGTEYISEMMCGIIAGWVSKQGKIWVAKTDHELVGPGQNAPEESGSEVGSVKKPPPEKHARDAGFPADAATAVDAAALPSDASRSDGRP